nr:MAG TPA: hypothetical protein [Caudoviricetes sp.]
MCPFKQLLFLKFSFLAFSPEKRGEAVSKPKTKNFFLTPPSPIY